MKRTLLFSVVLLLFHAPAWGQSVSGVRGINGGVAPLFDLVGPAGNLYADNQGTQGSMYTSGTFETFNFRNSSTGQAWSGAMMTLGPQQTIGLVSGANQGGFSSSTGTVILSRSPTIFPPAPREVFPLPRIQSSILDPEDILP